MIQRLPKAVGRCLWVLQQYDAGQEGILPVKSELCTYFIHI